MDYKLCKQLKKMGFPQGDFLSDRFYTFNSEARENIKIVGHRNALIYDKDIKIPSLSDLIEECGEGYLMLTRAKYGWIADGIDPTDRSTGKTPEEAVAKLWLKIKQEVL